MPKEQLKQAKVGMARMDLHPSAFALKGPLFKPPVNQLNWKRNLFATFLKIGLLSLLFCYLLWQTPVLEVLSQGFEWTKQHAVIGTIWLMEQVPKVWNWMLEQVPKVIDSVWNNPVPVSIGIMSGAIGFGTAAAVYSQAEGHHIRYRVGENKWKQAVRKERKRWKRSKRVKKPTRVLVPCEEVRAKMVHHHRFNNVSRPDRYEPPLVEQIRICRAHIEELDREIERHWKIIDNLYRKKREHEIWLKRATDKLKHDRNRGVKSKTCVSCGPNGCAEGTSCEPKPKRSKTWKKGDNGKRVRRDTRKKAEATTRQRTRLDRAKPCGIAEPVKRYTPGTILRVAMAKLIDLTKICSTKLSGNVSSDEAVLFDSGANICITNRKEDFVGGVKPIQGKSGVDGIGKNLKNEGYGWVAWTFVADNGMYRTFKLPCYYVPSQTQRIASLPALLQEYPDTTIHLDSCTLTISGDDRNPPLTVPFCAKTNLPSKDIEAQIKPKIVANLTVNATKANKKPSLPQTTQPSLTVPSNINMTEPEKELLRWHCRLGHISMKRVQWLFRQGILGTSEQSRRLQSSAAKLTHCPMCTACQFAKQRRKPMPGTVVKPIKEETNTLKRDKLFPGQEISIDHFLCNPLGRLLNTYGREKADAKYKGGCIFVDHSSNMTHVELQTHLNSHATLEAKKNFDAMCAEHGVVPQSFLSDNGTSFVNKDFEQYLQSFHQTIRHSAVGAHHSNGIAERGISTILSIARAMLHHSAIHWPDVADVTLWPLAVLHAVYIWNRIPREDTGRSPIGTPQSFKIFMFGVALSMSWTALWQMDISFLVGKPDLQEVYMLATVPNMVMESRWY